MNDIYLIITLIGILIIIGLWCKLMDAKEELKYLESKQDAKRGNHDE